MMILRFLRALVALFLMLFFSRTALADPLGRVIVVGTSGEIDDEAALRSAIGVELHATVVSADDPRASSATGTLAIEIRGADKRIAATYRTLGSPVSRTVDLPEDPKRARSVTVLLAGNVARQEADELLAASRKPAAKTASESAGATTTPNMELARLHAVLDPLAESRRTHRKWAAIALLIESGVSFGVGSYYLLEEPSTEPMRDVGKWLFLNGTLSAVIGTSALLARPSGYEGLRRALTNAEGAVSGDEAVRQVEARWAEEAADDRKWRQIWGWVGIGVGVTTASFALAIPEIVPSSQHESGVHIATWGLFFLGGLNVALGLHSLFDETAIEQSWHVYSQMKKYDRPKPTAAHALKPKVGLAPLPGGGMASLGFSF